MDLSNINDPAGIKALLDQLRNSQAWQETIASGPQADPAPISAVVSAGGSQERSVNIVNQGPTGSVADLLSLLQPSSPTQTPLPDVAPPNPPQQSLPPVIAAYDSSSGNSRTRNSSQRLGPPPTLAKEDLQSCSFQQALSILARLSSNSEFRRAVSNMKQEQADLERQLWEERRAILQKHESKVKVAMTKASLTGSEGLSQYDADVMTEACRKEINNFDRDRVLPAWDGLVSKQQTILQSLNCPLMYVTNMTADMQRQNRIIQVLEGILVDE